MLRVYWKKSRVTSSMGRDRMIPNKQKNTSTTLSEGKPWRIVPVHFADPDQPYKLERTHCGVRRLWTWIPWLWQVGIDHSWDKVTCKNCLRLKGKTVNYKPDEVHEFNLRKEVAIYEDCYTNYSNAERAEIITGDINRIWYDRMPKTKHEDVLAILNEKPLVS
jgi:hypothetical protein